MGMRAVEGEQKTTVGHITMLEALTAAAAGENASEELLDKAKRLIAKQKSEREAQHRIAETAPLCELSSWKDAAGADVLGTLPSWSMDTEQFQKWHDDYKYVVETAAQVQISEDLQNVALEQLVAIEQLLMEKKQIEQEDNLKSSKKKGKKK